MQDRESLQDEEFIRHRLYGGEGPAWKKYAALVLSRPTVPRLLLYELLTTCLGPIPGALGMALRKALYPALFPRIGRGVVFGARITIRHPERIFLGNGVTVDDDVLLDGRGAGDEGVVVGDRVILNRGACLQAKVGAITIGAESNVGAGVRIISQGPIRIAEKVSIAGGATIAGGRYVVEHEGDAADDKRRFTGGEIVIGRGARLGMNALIQDGVKIGEGAIVAPASVVLTDVAEGTVVSGFPARVWRERKEKGTEAATGAAPAAAEGPAEAQAATADPEVTAAVQSWLEDTRFAEFEGDDALAPSDSLFDHDILDSLGLVSLVAWLEETFGVSVTDEDLVPENFDSLERIAVFVTGRRTAAGA